MLTVKKYVPPKERCAGCGKPTTYYPLDWGVLCRNCFLEWAPQQYDEVVTQVRRYPDEVLAQHRVRKGKKKMATTPVTRAKFKVDFVHVQNNQDGSKHGESIRLSAVFGPGNESWSDATPSGQIDMYIGNPGAFDKLELHKEYFVDFTPVDAS